MHAFGEILQVRRKDRKNPGPFLHPQKMAASVGTSLVGIGLDIDDKSAGYLRRRVEPVATWIFDLSTRTALRSVSPKK